MDDVARAAGISRQGLYLHFRTKEAVFTEGVKRIAETNRANARAALAKEATIEERLVGAFEALHAFAIGQLASEHMNELMESAKMLVGAMFDDVEKGVVEDVTRALRQADIGARWKPSGVTAKELAEHLCVSSCGLMHMVRSLDAYREGMHRAARIICRGRG